MAVERHEALAWPARMQAQEAYREASIRRCCGEREKLAINVISNEAVLALARQLLRNLSSPSVLGVRRGFAGMPANNHKRITVPEISSL